MVRAPAFAFSLCLFLSPALAKPHCDPMPKAREGVHIADLTPGQRHFATGAFAATPPIGMPDGEIAKIVTATGHPGGIVLFMHGGLICDRMPVDSKFMDMLLGVATGPVNGSGDEL